MQSTYPSPQIFGIRHHGPGSAHSLLGALAEGRPHILLVEGPPDAQNIISWASDPALIPPVALLVYAPGDLNRAVYYPFALFSPEWQAMQVAARLQIPLRFVDLPVANRFAMRNPIGTGGSETPNEDEVEPQDAPPWRPEDPFVWIAEAAGYNDGERWWEHQIEERRNSRDLFRAILELMAALRGQFEPAENGHSYGSTPPAVTLETLREAAMRAAIRRAYDEGYQRVAVVCGAWHGPALQALDNRDADCALLDNLPSTPVASTWIPWTHGRLALASGYGAGVEAPGWYHHLWLAAMRSDSPSRLAVSWLTHSARLLRHEGLDVSSAHIIEAVRLAEALAALRGRPQPGLPELTEASQSIFCFGADLPLQLIHEELMVAEQLGSVPSGVPTVPLQADLELRQKETRLRPSATAKTLELDLRKPLHLARSHLLHRLALLGINWGELQTARSGRGTFHEDWRLAWSPELSIAVIEASIWGNRVAAAAQARCRQLASAATTLRPLTELAHHLLLAALPNALADLLGRIEALATQADDILNLMAALPPLVRTLRYGDVRATDGAMVAGVVTGLSARIAIGLPAATASLDDDAAARLFPLIGETHTAHLLLQDAQRLEEWCAALADVAQRKGVHGLVAGRCSRLLYDERVYAVDETRRRLGLVLSSGIDPLAAANWADGFLRGSGSVLIHDSSLWRILDDWIASLSSARFIEVLPLVRRTISTFTQPERRRLGELADHAPQVRAADPGTQDWDEERATAVLPLVAGLLGVVLEELGGR